MLENIKHHLKLLDPRLTISDKHQLQESHREYEIQRGHETGIYPEGILTRGENLIEIWNRGVRAVEAHILPEELTLTKKINGNRYDRVRYSHHPAGLQMTQLLDLDNYYMPEHVESAVPLFGYSEIMSGQDRLILDLGCGGGSAINTLALRYPQHRFVGGDLAIGDIAAGEGLIQPRSLYDNLSLVKMDWYDTGLEDLSVDAILSTEGVARYGNNDTVVQELTRIAKPGCIFRGTQDTGIVGIPNFSDRLIVAGWDVYFITSYRKKGTDEWRPSYSDKTVIAVKN